MSKYDDLCKRIEENGWLSHPLAAMKIGTPTPGISLSRVLKSTDTYHAFESGQTPPPFDRNSATPATLTYVDRNGTIVDRVLIDQAAGLMLHFNSDTGRPTIAFLSDVPRQHIAVFTQSNDPSQSPAAHDPCSTTLIEGQLVHVTLTVQERNPIARRRCIEHYGTSCIVCGFSFGRVYGEPFAGYIHVHHLTPLSTRPTGHEIDPIEDLRPMCPNCHSVIHSRQPPLTISEVKDILKAAGKAPKLVTGETTP